MRTVFGLGPLRYHTACSPCLLLLPTGQSHLPSIIFISHAGAVVADNVYEIALFSPVSSSFFVSSPFIVLTSFLTHFSTLHSPLTTCPKLRPWPPLFWAKEWRSLATDDCQKAILLATSNWQPGSQGETGPYRGGAYNSDSETLRTTVLDPSLYAKLSPKSSIFFPCGGHGSERQPRLIDPSFSVGVDPEF
jgi:hypothetical protein